MTSVEADLVGDVRERGGSFVGGDDQVGVVTVEAYDVVRRNDRAIGQVVGEVEEGTDEDLVARNTLCLKGRAICSNGRLTQNEAALRAGWHDDSILDGLRLHQPENFGPKVFWSVAPPQSAASNPRHPEMHPFDPGRRHKYLEEGTRFGCIGDSTGFELHRQCS